MPAIVTRGSRHASYRRREPEATLLYRVVAAEFDGLRDDLAGASPYGAGLPKHVDKELEGYLSCGQLHRGFARLVCRRCRAEHLVAFSCKGRGICPSCTTRRMHDTAAHLVDRVIPRVPIRQWVVTFPHRVRYHLAADPKIAAEALREVLRVIFAGQRRCARRIGVRPERAHSNGAITFVQRFNSALELSLHFHILVPDGVFVRNGSDVDARPRFVAMDAPTDDEVVVILDQIVTRVTGLLRRRGRLDGEALDNEPEPHLLAATRPPKRNNTPFVEEPLPPLCARRDGFSLHAGREVHKNDRVSLERLARYGLRPALALERLSEAPDGTLLYEMKRRFSDGRHVLRFTPREFLLRLCALVPPRGFHMIRYHGIFSAHARGRHALTGRGMRDQPTCVSAPSTAPTPTVTTQPSPPEPPPSGTSSSLSPVASTVGAPRSSKQGVHAWPGRVGADDPAHAGADVVAADDPGRPRRLAWAVLMKRAYAVDVLVCPRCAGPMRLVSVIQDERVARRILEHLGLPARAPPRGRPWRAAGQEQLALDDRDRFDGVDPAYPN